MEIVDAWMVFGGHIHQGFLRDFPDFFSGVAVIFNDLSSREQEEFCSFLKKLLESGYPATKKLEVWNKSGSELYVTPSQIDAFLSQILDVVEAEKRRLE